MEFPYIQIWQEIYKLMINHKYKLIFIHIPRTGGTSIEKALCGKDWFNIHAPSKHLNAYSAKKIYSEYWDKYFKFTFVRNPWDRMVSMLKYGNFYGVGMSSDKICMKNYLTYFESIEYDKRFFNLKQFEDFQKLDNSVYRNIIGEEMDFIGRFENLQEDYNEICKQCNIKENKLPLMENSPERLHYREYYDQENKNLVAEKYKLDIKMFNYEF